MIYGVDREKKLRLTDDAENNTVIATANSNYKTKAARQGLCQQGTAYCIFCIKVGGCLLF